MSLLCFWFVAAISVLLYRTSADELHFGDSNKRDYHYQSRYIRCARKENNEYQTSCNVVADKQSTKAGERCLSDFEPTLKNVRSLCPTLCRYANEYEIVHKAPSNNHVCIKFENYGLIKREKDVYLWRRGDCINETIAFTVNCGFPFSRKNLDRINKDPLLYLARLLARQ